MKSNRAVENHKYPLMPILILVVFGGCFGSNGLTSDEGDLFEIVL